MSETIYDRWKSTVRRVAQRVARDYPDVEAEDLEQDLWVAITEMKWDKIFGKRVKLLTKIAHRKAGEYRAQHLIISPQFAYRVSHVREILNHVFDRENWVKIPPMIGNPGDTTPRKRGTEPSYNIDELLAEYSDVARAWKRLPVQYKRLILRKHGLDEEFERGSSEERTYYRAVARLTDIINGVA